MLQRFTAWLEAYGETSCAITRHFSRGRSAAGPRRSTIGTNSRHRCVAPMIFFEAFLPGARRFFIIRRGSRSPTPTTRWDLPSFRGDRRADYLERAIHFLELQKSRSPGFRGLLLGLPVRLGHAQRHVKAQTPFITTTPYVLRGVFAGLEIQRADEWPVSLQMSAR